MMKKAIFLLVTMVAFLVLAACSSGNSNTVVIAPLATQSSNNTGQSSNNTSSTPAAASTSLESRLAPGILSLEGTNLAVTAQQAKQLLPLWQQVQTLDTSSTTQASDYTTVYQQIESTLTTDQINAIQSMSVNQSDLQALMTKFGIQITPGAFGGGYVGGSGGTSSGSGTRATLSPDQLATRTAQRTLTPGGTGGGGFFRGTGTPPAGGQFGNRGGMNTLFITPLIQLLQTRASS